MAQQAQFKLDYTEALNVLEKLRDNYLQSVEDVKLKRKWKASERAMTIAHYLRNIAALNMAIDKMKGVT